MAKTTYPPSQNSWYMIMRSIFPRSMRRKAGFRKGTAKTVIRAEARFIMSRVAYIVTMHAEGLVTAENAVRVIRDIVGQDGK
jgi:hypothetical protein